MKARLHQKPVITVSRGILKYKKIVYLLVSKRPIRYPRGSSRIAYIGTTTKGIQRVASSAAYRASDILSGYGLSTMEIYVITCPPKRNVKTWLLLERALLAQFVVWFIKPPKCNSQGKHFKWTPKMEQHFSKRGIDNILSQFDN